MTGLTHILSCVLGLSAYLNYTFPTHGNFSMKVTVENCVSHGEAVIWYKVEIPIVGLGIVPIHPIAYGNSSIVYFTISKYDGDY